MIHKPWNAHVPQHFGNVTCWWRSAKKKKHHQFVSLVTSQRPIEMDNLKILQDWNHGIMWLIMNHAKSQQVWQRCADLEDSHGRCPLEVCWLTSQHRKKLIMKMKLVWVKNQQTCLEAFFCGLCTTMCSQVLVMKYDLMLRIQKLVGAIPPVEPCDCRNRAAHLALAYARCLWPFRSHGGGPKRIFVAWQVATQVTVLCRLVRSWRISMTIGCVWKCCVPLKPMVLLIIIPIKWLFHWEYTLFSDKPNFFLTTGSGKSPSCTLQEQPPGLSSAA